MAVNDVYESTLQFSLDGKSNTVSIHLLETAASSESAAETAEALNPLVVTRFWSDFWQQYAATLCIFQQITTQKIHPTREQFIEDDSDSGTGSQPGDPMIAANAVLITEYAENWGRRFTGKSFWPGLPEDDEQGGSIQSAVFANIQGSADTAYATPIDTGPPINAQHTPCVFSRSQVKDGLTPVASIIRSPVVQQVVTHQVRRRRPFQ